MECRLSYSDKPWRCQVSLRFENSEMGAKSDVIMFGPPVTDENELEAVLRRAQYAILNPDIARANPLKFIELDLSRMNQGGPLSREQLAFSSDVVCLDVAGPSVPDLSFIDLPGRPPPPSAVVSVY